MTSGNSAELLLNMIPKNRLYRCVFFQDLPSENGDFPVCYYSRRVAPARCTAASRGTRTPGMMEATRDIGREAALAPWLPSEQGT